MERSHWKNKYFKNMSKEKKRPYEEKKILCETYHRQQSLKL